MDTRQLWHDGGHKSFDAWLEDFSSTSTSLKNHLCSGGGGEEFALAYKANQSCIFFMVHILAVADENELYDNPVEFPRVDILFSCGDLSPHYLGFLSDKYMPAIRIMVHGNHDGQYFEVDEEPVNLDYSEKYFGMFSIVKGIHVLTKEEYPFLEDDLSICGFSGISAHGDSPFYYSDYSLFRFKTDLFFKKYFSLFSGVDIMLTHAPPDFGLIGYGGGNHRPSRKIAALQNYLDPKLWLYGHIHRRYTDKPLDFLVDEGAPLNLINACPYQYFFFDQQTGRIKFLESSS